MQINIFAIFRDKTLLNGSSYMELLPGSFTGRHWGPNSIFIDEDMFVIIEPLIRKHAPHFYHYDNSEVSDRACMLIANDLIELAQAIDVTTSRDEIAHLSNYFANTYQSSFDSLNDAKRSVSLFILELAEWITIRFAREEKITILGVEVTTRSDT